MSKLFLSGHIVVPENEVEMICNALPLHISLTRKEAGCLKFEVRQRDNAPCIFDVYEEFISKEAFEYHQKRVKESAWGKLSVNVERNYSISEFSE